MSVAGETTYSTQGRTAQKFAFEPVPSKDWEAKINGDKFEIRAKQEPGSIPYINGAFEILDSAAVDGGKNRVIFKMFFLSLKPGKDGNVSPDRADGILGMARSLGIDAEFDILSKNDKDGVPVFYLNPKTVLQWIKDNSGAVVRLHSKVVSQKGADGKPNGERKAEVDYFIAAE